MNGYEHARRVLLRLGQPWVIRKQLKDSKGTFGLIALHHIRDLAVIYSHAELEQDNNRTWLHVSVSTKEGDPPFWSDMARIKELFIGNDMEAYQISPPLDRYVDIHAGCLHWWSCLDAPKGVLPRFEEGTEEHFGQLSI